MLAPVPVNTMDFVGAPPATTVCDATGSMVGYMAATPYMYTFLLSAPGELNFKLAATRPFAVADERTKMVTVGAVGSTVISIDWAKPVVGERDNSKSELVLADSVPAKATVDTLTC